MTQVQQKLQELQKTGIPVIDFGPYFKDSANANLVVQQVRFAIDRYGFFAVTGVDEYVNLQLFEDAYEKLIMALNQPPEVFVRCADPDGLSQHGMADYGAETAVGQQTPDPKKYLQMFADTPEQCFPEAEVPGIYDTFQELFKKCEELGRIFHQVFAEGFGLPKNFFDEMLKGSKTLIRGIRYISEMSNPGDVIAGEHTDVNACTLLFTAKGEGLYVVDPITKDKIWIDVPPGALVVNTCDQFCLLMNTIPGRHGVIYPETLQGDRYTIVAFIHYLFDKVLLDVGRLFHQLVQSTSISRNVLAEFPLFQLASVNPLVSVGDFFFMRISRINGDGNYDKQDKVKNPYTVADLRRDLSRIVQEAELQRLAIFNSFNDEEEQQFPLTEKTW